MSSAFLTLAALLALSLGRCSGAGIITTDLAHGVTGESATFTTSVKPTAEPFLALTWSFNGTVNVITSASVDVVGPGYESRIVLDKSTGSLVLRNLTEEDSGEYELIIIPRGAEQMQGVAKLAVQTKVSKPNMDCPTANMIESKAINLTCDADGSVMNTMWMRDGKPLIPGDRFSFYDNNRVLSINPLDRRDTGAFQCNVSNTLNSETGQCDLLVNYGPDEPMIMQDPIGAELEESVTLSCFADSLPKAEYVWRFKKKTMSGPVHYIEEMEKKHLGEYTCTASNSVTGLEASDVHNLRDSSTPVSGSMSMLICTVLTSVGLMLVS